MTRFVVVLCLLCACGATETEGEGVPQKLTLSMRGLATSPNAHGDVPAGSLWQADDVVLSADGVLSKRRAMESIGTKSLTSIFGFKGSLLGLGGSTLSRSSDGATWTDYSQAVDAVSGRRLRAIEQNGNAYLASGTGVKRLDALTGTVVDAGVPAALDAAGALTGGSGFMPNDSAVAYRVLWGTRDANANLILGAPSGRAVVTNSAGGTRDVIVSATVPGGIDVSRHFWQVYRSQASATAATDPGDDLGLVYEGAAPSAASVTSLARAANVVTATTSSAHGFSTGQQVRISPGGTLGGTLAAVGLSSAAATSPDGITWTGRTITGNYNAVAWNGSVYAAVGNSATAASSPDGITWTARTIPVGWYTSVIWTGSLFVAVGFNSPNSTDPRCATSPDGITWTARTMPAGGNYTGGLGWNGSLLLAAGTNLATSPDGITWTARTPPAATAYNGVGWSGARWVTVDNSLHTWVSTDAVNWSQAGNAPALPVCQTMVGNGSVLVCGVGSGGAAWTANGGASWSSATGLSLALRGLAYDATNARFVGVGASYAATSADGAAWTSQTIPAGNYMALAASGAVFSPGERTITVTDATHFTYAETGADGTLSQAQTATPLTVAVTDNIPSTFTGASLYTNQGQEGILASQYEPPIAADLAAFKGSVFWLNTQDRASLDLYLLATGASSGVQAGDTLTVNGVAYTAGANLAAESVATRTFGLKTDGTAAQNVAATADSLIRIVNRSQGSAVTARYMSGPNDVPGWVRLDGKARTDTITVSVSRASSWHFPAGLTKAPEANPHELRWSPLQRPDANPLPNFVRLGSKDKAGLRVIGTRDSLFVLKEDGNWHGTGVNGAWAFEPFDSSAIVIAPDTAVVLNNAVFALSTLGVVKISDTGISIVSDPIKDILDPYLVGALLTTTRTVAHAAADESSGRYFLWLPSASSDTEAKLALTYDVLATARTGEDTWTVRSDDAACAVLNPADGKLYSVAGSTVSRERKTSTDADYTSVAATVQFAPVIGAPGALSHYQEVSLLFRRLGGDSFTVSFSSELEPSEQTVTVLGSDYGFSDAVAVGPINLRIGVPSSVRRAERLNVKIVHSRSAPMDLEGAAVLFTPTTTRLRR